MKALIEKKEKLNEIRNQFIIEAELVGNRIGLSLTDDSIERSYEPNQDAAQR